MTTCRHWLDGADGWAYQCGRKTPLDLVREFREASGGPVGEAGWSRENLTLRMRLIFEEAEEATDEINNFVIKPLYRPGYGPITSKQALAKELADVVYVAYGTADSLGIDLDRVLKAVHASNMSKFSGEVETRPDGKVLKGNNYREPDLSFVEE